MTDFQPTQQQLITDWQQNPHIFAYGLAGTGKTTAARSRLLSLLSAGVPAEQILVLLPQRTLAAPYHQVLRLPSLPPGGQATVVTMGGLAQRMTSLFWPLVSQSAGFKQPNKPPTYLTLETAQYFLTRIVKPLLSEGYFEAITIDPNRLYSQVIDNLNKAASIGFSPATIAERLKSAWSGKPGQEIVYDQAQDCALRFRSYCLDHNLLDFSLQLELFSNFIWPSFLGRSYLTSTYRHLIYDNIEEDVPVTHDIVRQWLPDFETSLLIYDEEAGYRAFLGADPDSSRFLHSADALEINLQQSFTISSSLHIFNQAVNSALLKTPLPSDPELEHAFNLSSHRFLPEMADWVASQVTGLVDQGVPPSQIVILAPFLSDSLRFSLMNHLQAAGIPSRSHRPSRSLRDEPAARCLLALAAIAHPHWKLTCTREQLRNALMLAMTDLDLVRADLISRTLFIQKNDNQLNSFDQLKSEMQNRITFTISQQYEVIRSWLQQYRQDQPQELDVFISRLFGEVLSQPTFGFHQNIEAARVTANLIESIQKFRQVTLEVLQSAGQDIGREYIQMVQEGILAAQYLGSWNAGPQEAVLIAPAYTFLINNQPVDYQFWLDIGSQGWWERLYQPLTHPIVLSRHWQTGRKWTDVDENENNQKALSRLVTGLLNRCRQQVFLCATGMDERGERQRGPLMRSIQTILLTLNAQNR